MGLRPKPRCSLRPIIRIGLRSWSTAVRVPCGCSAASELRGATCKVERHVRIQGRPSSFGTRRPSERHPTTFASTPSLFLPQQPALSDAREGAHAPRFDLSGREPRHCGAAPEARIHFYAAAATAVSVFARIMSKDLVFQAKG